MYTNYILHDTVSLYCKTLLSILFFKVSSLAVTSHLHYVFVSLSQTSEAERLSEASLETP